MRTRTHNALSELSAKANKGLITPLLLTLYVDDGSIAAATPTREEAMEVVKIVFKATHRWLEERGLKTDPVKNELMQFTQTRTGRNASIGPSISIPSHIENAEKPVLPSRLMRYLGIRFDPHLRFTEHVRRSTSKAASAAQALWMLGNSERGLHQTHFRQLYLGAILPIAFYGFPVFWCSQSKLIFKLLAPLQNKCLRVITGAFRTTNIHAKEIEASIPPIDVLLKYKLKMEATRLSRLPDDHPVINRL
jgi:hypothetical protein